MWVIAVLLGVMTPAAVTQDQRIEEARQTVLTDDYQPTLPQYTPRTQSETDPQPAAQPKDKKWTGDDSDEDRYRQSLPHDRDTGAVGSILQFLMWGVMIVVIAIGAFWIGSELLGGKDDAKLAAEADEDTPPIIDTAVVEKPLGDADEWARKGDFGEAIHTLLLRTLQELVRSSAIQVAPATTSREILARVPLLADAREALAGLIVAVEITHFGGDVATAEDYGRCRDQFNRFATAFRGARA